MEASTANQIWSEQFNGDLSDIFALQDDVTRAIVGQLQPELMQAEWRRGARAPTESLDAWTLLHSARMRFQVGHGRDAMEEAVRLAEAALEKDPNYAEALGFLTWVLMDRVMTRWSVDIDQDNERAAGYCRKALELDPENPIVLFGAALLNVLSGRPDAALAQIERCCAINPNDAFAQGIRGWISACAGAGIQGLDAAELALRLSPRDPRSYFLLVFKAYAHLLLEQYDEAERDFNGSIDLYDGFFWSQLGFAVSLAMLGKNAEAKRAILDLERISPDFGLEGYEKIIGNWLGNPTDERRALIDGHLDSLRAVWPS